MAQVSTSDMRSGMKVEIDGQPYVIVTNEFVKPGKGQAFNRVKVKHLLTGRVVEKVLKSGDKLTIADVVESEMRMLYREGESVVFMDDQTFEQIHVSNESLADVNLWLKEDLLYTVIFYKGSAVSVQPPTFLELEIVETAPASRGDTVSGRVLKPAVLETGAKVQIPIFVNQGERIKVDTRTGEYVSRV